MKTDQLAMTNKDTCEVLNRQGLKLLSECGRQNEGCPVMISPFSIDVAFAMLKLGAEGLAKDEIETALGLPKDLTDFASVHHRLMNSIEPRLLSSNGIWINRTFPLSPAYSERVERSFNQNVSEFDNTRPKESAEKINAVVRENTSGMITNLLQPASIASDTGLILINALYFKGRWCHEFEKKSTKTHCEFNSLNNTATYVDMMHDCFTVPYAEGADYQVVSLPYRGSAGDESGNEGPAIDCQFVAILPTPELKVEDLLRRLYRGNAFQDMLDRCKPHTVRIKLPRLDFEFDTSLRNALINEGMQHPFVEDVHSFPSITESEHNDVAITHISDVIHATRINLDEESTEAAAATAILGMCTTYFAGWPKPTPPTPKFIADHPFLCFILEKKTGMLLFAGIVREIGDEKHHAKSRWKMILREKARRFRFAKDMAMYMSDMKAYRAGRRTLRPRSDLAKLLSFESLKYLLSVYLFKTDPIRSRMHDEDEEDEEVAEK